MIEGETIQDTFQSKLNTLISKTVEEEKMEEDLDFFLRNNVNQRKIVEKKKYTTWKLKPYNTSRIKSQNILTKLLDFRTAEWSRKICTIEISCLTLVF